MTAVLPTVVMWWQWDTTGNTPHMLTAERNGCNVAVQTEVAAADIATTATFVSGGAARRSMEPAESMPRLPQGESTTVAFRAKSSVKRDVERRR